MQATTTAPSAPGTVPRWMWIVGAAVALCVTGVASALAWQSAAREAVPPAPALAAATDKTNGQPAPVQRAGSQRAEPSSPAVAACRDCGVVESVQAVKVKGEASGVGAVAGGVLGGVVGHQFGKGNGRTAMTVLGAVGGGVAGNEVEKQVKAKTVYTVRVRMDDGSLRTLQQSQPPATGARVQVEGSTLRAV